MQVREFMSRPVITVRADAPVEDAAQLLVRHGFTGMPVTDDDDHLIGFVTEADLLRGQILERDAAPARNVRRFSRHVRSTVGIVMSTMVESLTPGAEITDAVRIMVDERIRCLPVVDGLRIVGVISRRDLLRAGLAQHHADSAAEVVDSPSVPEVKSPGHVVPFASGALFPTAK